MYSRKRMQSGIKEQSPICCPVDGQASRVWWRDDKVVLRQCRLCGLVFQYPPQTWNEVEPLYDGEFFTRRNRETNPKDMSWQRMLFEYRLQEISELLGSRCSRIRILDVGGAMGNFALTAQCWGWDVTVIEPAKDAAKYIRRELKLPVYEATLEEADLPPQSFDIVHMTDVLEHVPSPVATLSDVNRLLRPDGLLYVIVPDERLWRRLKLMLRFFKAERIGLSEAKIVWPPLGHLYMFQQSNLRGIAERAGLRVIRMRREGLSHPILGRWALSNYQSKLKRSMIHLCRFTKAKMLLGGGYIVMIATPAF